MIWNKKNVSDLIKKQTGMLKRDFKLSPTTTITRGKYKEFYTEITILKTKQRLIASYVNGTLTLKEI